MSYNKKNTQLSHWILHTCAYQGYLGNCHLVFCFSNYALRRDFQDSLAHAKACLFLLSTGSEGRPEEGGKQRVHMGILHGITLPEGFCVPGK